MRHGFRAMVIAVAAVSLVAIASNAALAQQKTLKQCTEEWRTNKVDNQAKGITEKAYVAQCRAGTAAAQPSAQPTAAPAPTAAPSATTSSQKTAKQCIDEWRANKADNQAKGITEKAYVSQCRAGAAAAQPANTPANAPAPTPSQAAPARAPAPSQTATPAAPRPAPTATAAPTGANQFANEAQAKSHCPSDLVVWVNADSSIYHFSGHKAYGTTKQGAYMCERDATAAGNRAAKNEKHP